ncbi:MAG: NAD(P)H-hydrate dehydratase [Ferruginibacter sp.]
MKILSAAQFREWDAYTIAHEPILSVNLMERAANACCEWLLLRNWKEFHFRIFCGKGNNGGDGLAIARLLMGNNCLVTVYIVEEGNFGSPDFQLNLERLHAISKDIHFLQSADFFPALDGNDIVIDALFGTGLNKPLTGIYAALINHINRQASRVIAIDLPSGLFADTSSKNNPVISAGTTLSFQQYKLAFLMAENAGYCGEIVILDIGLDPDFPARQDFVYSFSFENEVRALYRPRSPFAHKGSFGHAALFAGSYGMMGAAILSAAACLRGGAGKLTCHIPTCGYQVLQTAIPETMCLTAGENYLAAAPLSQRYDAIGIGPGIGQHSSHKELLEMIFRQASCPLVIDADGLNTIARYPELLQQIPAATIITPHPGEFDRLFGKTENDFERLELAIKKAVELSIYIVLKGHFTCICTPRGKGHFNTTGNPGMATAGSGDVLTGLLTALLAQHYPPVAAAVMGVYLHGLAGDIALRHLSPESLLAGDIIRQLPDAFRKIAAEHSL